MYSDLLSALLFQQVSQIHLTKINSIGAKTIFVETILVACPTVCVKPVLNPSSPNMVVRTT